MVAAGRQHENLLFAAGILADINHRNTAQLLYKRVVFVIAELACFS